MKRRILDFLQKFFLLLIYIILPERIHRMNALNAAFFCKRIRYIRNLSAPDIQNLNLHLCHSVFQHKFHCFFLPYFHANQLLFKPFMEHTASCNQLQPFFLEFCPPGSQITDGNIPVPYHISLFPLGMLILQIFPFPLYHLLIRTKFLLIGRQIQLPEII